MDSIVISIGGSVILSDDIGITYFEELALLLKKTINQYKIYIIVGGGKTARTYIKLGRELDMDEQTLDQIGIE